MRHKIYHKRFRVLLFIMFANSLSRYDTNHIFWWLWNVKLCLVIIFLTMVKVEKEEKLWEWIQSKYIFSAEQQTVYGSFICMWFICRCTMCHNVLLVAWLILCSFKPSPKLEKQLDKNEEHGDCRYKFQRFFKDRFSKRKSWRFPWKLGT